MVQVVTVETFLEASPVAVWEAVNQPRVLLQVAHPMIRFTPIRPQRFPERWEDGDYLVHMHWRGLVPLGRHLIRISHPPPKAGMRFMLDDGHGVLCRRWRHLVSIAPDRHGTTYCDQVEVDAGPLTGVVADFARRFYSHRQARWRMLVRAGLDVGEIPARVDAV